MPTKVVEDILARLRVLENKMEKHFEESGVIQTDLTWIKRSIWGLIGLFTAIFAAILRFIALHVTWH